MKCVHRNGENGHLNDNYRTEMYRVSNRMKLAKLNENTTQTYILT
jgi:hypothetical protein